MMSQVNVGVFRVDQVGGSKDLQLRLHELGFFRGTELEVLKKIPFGGPFVVRLGNTLLALREDELKLLSLSRVL